MNLPLTPERLRRLVTLRAQHEAASQHLEHATSLMSRAAQQLLDVTSSFGQELADAAQEAGFPKDARVQVNWETGELQEVP